MKRHRLCRLRDTLTAIMMVASMLIGCGGQQELISLIRQDVELFKLIADTMPRSVKEQHDDILQKEMMLCVSDNFFLRMQELLNSYDKLRKDR